MLMVLTFSLKQCEKNTLKTNDLSQSSLNTSSLPDCLLDSSQLDLKGRAGILFYFLRNELGKCAWEHGVGSIEFNDCVTYHFFQCPYKFQSLVEGSDIIVYARVKKCMKWCFSKGEVPRVEYGACLFNCYEKRIKDKSRC
jgi:hypothetical protein